MASSYSTLLRLELQAAGENNDTWGDKANTVFQLLENAISKRQALTVDASDVTLTVNNGADDQARSLCLAVTGTLTGNRAVIVPALSKLYLVTNGTSGAFTLTVKTSAGSGIEVLQGGNALLYCDGTNVISVGYSFSTAPISFHATSAGWNANSLASTGTAYTDYKLNSISKMLVGAAGTNDAIVTGLLANDGFFRLPSGGFVYSADGGASIACKISDAALYVKTAIELGHASDTTLTRIAAGRVAIEGIEIGYRQVPRSTTATTLVVGDVGKCVAITATIAVPNSTFAEGDAISIYNDSAGALTITHSAGTGRIAGVEADDVSISLAARGIATIWFNSATEWVISGNVS